MDFAQLKSLKTVHQLAAHFGLSYHELGSLLYGTPAASNYRVFRIRKRSGGLRDIAAPRFELKFIQRRLLTALTEAYHPTRSAFGFVRHRSILGGADHHVDRRVVVNLDLADFFPSISFWRVRGLFLSTHFDLPYKVATVLAQLCCYNGVLPQGAPTSPIISNFVCSAMDRELGAFVGARGGRYSRYCDDLTMSFESEFLAFRDVAKRGARGLELGGAIEGIISKHGFLINRNKFKLRTSRERQEVTGLIVNKKINVRREFVKRLHTQLHCVERFGLSAAAERYFDIEGAEFRGNFGASFSSIMRGRIHFVKMVRGNGDSVFAGLAKRFNAAVGADSIKYYRRVESDIDLAKAVWVVEVSYDDPDWGYRDSQGTAFLMEGVGLVTCAHVVIDDKAKRPFKEIYIFRIGDRLRRYRAYVASFDPTTDLALLYVESIDYFAECDVRLKLSAIDGVPGCPVLMVGFPSYREGQSVFSARTEIAAVYGNYLEVGGQVIGGISGGPLLDSKYGVVGIITRGVPGGGAKNEAIRARSAFFLNFKQQDLQLVESAGVPYVDSSFSKWKLLAAWVKATWRRFRLSVMTQ